MPSLAVSFLGINFANPLVLPSGIIQAIPAHKKAEDSGVGGVVTKTVTMLPREGNPLPRVVKYEHGYLNSVGLRNPGIKKAVPQLKKFISKANIPVIVSIFSTDVSEFKQLALAVQEINPDFVELNLSCPNTTDELGNPLGLGVESTRKVVAEVRQAVGSELKLIAKLSPNVPDIGAVAKAAAAAGIDGISAINAVGPGMVIDIQKRKPVLGNKEGGVSGPGIKPIAVRCIYDIYRAVKVPLIGIGGVTKWEDVIEMMLAGATLVGIGSAAYMQGYGIYEEIKTGLLQYMSKNKLDSLATIIGVAHNR